MITGGGNSISSGTAFIIGAVVIVLIIVLIAVIYFLESIKNSSTVTKVLLGIAAFAIIGGSIGGNIYLESKKMESESSKQTNGTSSGLADVGAIVTPLGYGESIPQTEELSGDARIEGKKNVIFEGPTRLPPLNN